MNAIIIDDDTLSAEMVNILCKKYGMKDIPIFLDPIEGFNYMVNNQEDIDIVFLDVHMPDISGFNIIENNFNTKIVMMSSEAKNAVKAFEYDVVDFLLKPIELNRFMRTMKRVEDRIERENLEMGKVENTFQNQIYFNLNKRLINISLDNIEYIEAKGNYVMIKTVGEEVGMLIHTTLKKVSIKLPSNRFFQVHRSFVINIEKIIDIQDSTIVINKKVIPIGKTYRDRLIGGINLVN